MTQTQETYNKYITSKSICQGCKKEVSFQSITDWGYELNRFKCPYCKVLTAISSANAIDSVRRMAFLDKALVKQLLEYANQGQLHNHEIADTTQWACLCLVEKGLNCEPEPIPLSYIQRMFLVQLYRQLVEGGKMPEIDIYAIQAPIPVEVVQPRIGTLTHQIQSAKKAKAKKKKKKAKAKDILDTFTIGAVTPKKKKKKKKKKKTGVDIFSF